MPKPKKQKSPKKWKKAPVKKGKRSSGMRQTVKVSVRVREGAEGGGAPPIVYATYAPTPPAQPTQFLFDAGMPPAPVKREPADHRSTGVGTDQPSTSSTGTRVRSAYDLHRYLRPKSVLQLEQIKPNTKPIV